jgi:hypothetical protein
MEGYRVNSAHDAPPKSWWEKNWVWLAAGIPVAVVFIVADDYGYGGLFEWAFGFAAGTAVAVACFWERRSARWFVPTVAFLIVAHIIVLASRQWHLLPSRSTGTYMALKGVAGMDFAVSGSFLWLVHRLFDPRVGIKAHWSATAKVGTCILALVFLGTVAFTVAVIAHAHNEKIASSRLVFSAKASGDLKQVTTCIDADAVENDQWDDVRGRYAGKQIFSDIWGRTIRVLDMGKHRLIQVETAHGRPLRKDERQRVEKCAE